MRLQPNRHVGISSDVLAQSYADCFSAQPGQQFTQPGPFGPGFSSTKVFIRPEGPLVPFDTVKERECSALQASGFVFNIVFQGRRALAR